MTNANERRLILEMIANGKITAEEGLRLIQALPPDEPEDEFETEAETESTATPSSSAAFTTAEPQVSRAEETAASEGAPNHDRLRRWWTIPLWAGVSLVVASSLLMFWAQRAAGFGFWFYCTWVPFLAGLAVVALAWSSRTSRWLHLQVQQKPGDWPEKFTLSFPLPLGLAAWFFRYFGRYIPGLKNTPLDDTILALNNSVSADSPLIIEVNDDESGEHVQIFIS